MFSIVLSQGIPEETSTLSLNIFLSGLDFKDLCFHYLVDLNPLESFLKSFCTQTQDNLKAIGLVNCAQDTPEWQRIQRVNKADPNLSHFAFLLGLQTGLHAGSGKSHYPAHVILHSVAGGRAPHPLWPEGMTGQLQQWLRCSQ